jgi:hypothetical protein
VSLIDVIIARRDAAIIDENSLLPRHDMPFDIPVAPEAVRAVHIGHFECRWTIVPGSRLILGSATTAMCGDQTICSVGVCDRIGNERAGIPCLPSESVE